MNYPTLYKIKYTNAYLGVKIRCRTFTLLLLFCFFFGKFIVYKTFYSCLGKTTLLTLVSKMISVSLTGHTLPRVTASFCLCGKNRSLKEMFVSMCVHAHTCTHAQILLQLTTFLNEGFVAYNVYSGWVGCYSSSDQESQADKLSQKHKRVSGATSAICLPIYNPVLSLSF